MTDTASPPTKSFLPYRPPFIVLGIVVAAICLMRRGLAMTGIESGMADEVARAAKSSSDIEYGAGLILAAGLVVLGIVDRIMFRLSGRKRGLPGGYMIAGAFALVVIGVAVGASFQSVASNQAAEHSAKTSATLDQFLRDIETTGNTTREEYLNELAAVGWNNLMDAERLATDRDLTQTEKILADGSLLVGKYAQRTRGNLEKVPMLLQQLDVPEAAKTEFLAGWQPGYPAMLAKVNKVWDIEGQVVEQFRAVARLLRDGGKWEIVNGQIQFEQQEDLNSFNEIMANIQRSVMEQQQIQQEVAPSTSSP